MTYRIDIKGRGIAIMDFHRIDNAHYQSTGMSYRVLVACGSLKIYWRISRALFDGRQAVL
jgi:hypothetical protein